MVFWILIFFFFLRFCLRSSTTQGVLNGVRGNNPKIIPEYNNIPNIIVTIIINTANLSIGDKKKKKARGI